jgi:hypothetical protein
MVPEQISVAHIGLQHVHDLVPRHVPHLEHGSAAAGCAGQEAGAERMGAEVGPLEPDPLGIGLDDAAYTLIGEPLVRERCVGWSRVPLRRPAALPARQFDSP